MAVPVTELQGLDAACEGDDRWDLKLEPAETVQRR